MEACRLTPKTEELPFDTNTVYVGGVTYNALGQVTERRLGSANGVVRQLYSYTATENFRLVTLQSGVSPNYNTLQNIGYSYDDAGNVWSITDAAAFGGSQTQSFSYDDLNRLKTAQATGGSYGTYSQRSYAYSNAGNITSFEGMTLAYNDAAHKHAITHIGGVQKYWYDQNGNATRRINGSQDVTLGYDAENRPTGMTGSVTASYVYDGDGNRVADTIVPEPGDPQALNRYVYTFNNHLRLVDPNGFAPQYPGDPDPHNAPFD